MNLLRWRRNFNITMTSQIDGRLFIFSSPEPKAQGELIVWDSSRCNSLSCPPGQLAPRGQAVPGYLAPPTLVIFTPGGQAVRAGLSCPPANTSKNICMLFGYFPVSF